MARQVKAYEMKLIFSGSVGLKTINDILHQCGCNEKLHIRDALKINLTQTLLRIPDEEYLSKVARILEENYETKELKMTECHFVGYEYIREVLIDDDETAD